EFRAGFEGCQVAAQVADVETPVDGPLNLRAALAPDLVGVGVVPQVLDGAREAAVAVKEGRAVCDRSPAVQVVFSVQGEMYSDVLTPVPCGGLPCPGAGDHQARDFSHPLPERAVDPRVAGMADTELVAGDYEQRRVRRVAKSFDE